MFLLILRERERDIDQLPPISTRNWESNLRPFGIWDGAPTNWATHPGFNFIF